MARTSGRKDGVEGPSSGFGGQVQEKLVVEELDELEEDIPKFGTAKQNPKVLMRPQVI